MKKAFDIIVIGGGMGGLVLAELLSRDGREVALLERQPRFSPPLRGENLQPNGLKILDQLGLLDAVRVADIHSNQVFHFYRTDGTRLCTIDYRMLPPPYQYTLMTLPEVPMGVLLGRLTEKREVAIHWGCEFSDLLREKGRVAGVRARRRPADAPGEAPGEALEFKAPVVVGADGVHSKVREKLDLPFALKGYGHGYLTLFVERPKDFGSEALYFVGRRQILGVFPISSKSLYLFYLMPARSLPGLKSDPRALERLKQAIASIHPPLREPLQALSRWEQVAFMPCWRVRVGRWVSDGAALLGDAAHAMNPHASQGRNQAMEDALALAEVLEACFKAGDFSAAALSAYERGRRHRVERFQRLADEQVFFWNAGDPVRTWLRDRVFRTLDGNDRLRYRMLAQVAGLPVRPFGLLDRLRAAGFLPDAHARRRT